MAFRRCWYTAALGVLFGALGCESSTGLDPESNPLIQTDSPQYTLQTEGIGWGVDIPYVFTNRTGAIVHLANCLGSFPLHLERKDQGAWHTAWSPVILLCSMPSIVIDRNARFADTLRVWGAPQDSDRAPQFDTDEPSGTYRIVWDAVGSPDRLIPLEMRVSNEFVLRK